MLDLGKTFVALLAVALGACTFVPDAVPPEAARVAADGAALLARTRARGAIPEADWPASIARLRPRDIRASDEGLYICTARWFVAEKGFFVPRAATRTVVGPHADPGYRLVAANLYTYRIEG